MWIFHLEMDFDFLLSSHIKAKLRSRKWVLIRSHPCQSVTFLFCKKLKCSSYVTPAPDSAAEQTAHLSKSLLAGEKIIDNA